MLIEALNVTFAPLSLNTIPLFMLFPVAIFIASGVIRPLN
jgi:hypothetical protein